MGRLFVVENLSLDGVMQGPARADEDTRGGFPHGGWAAAVGRDAVIGQAMAERMAKGRPGGGLLLGRWTYQSFFDVWPKRKDNPYTDVLNRTEKYVASNSLTEPLPWEHSTLVSGDIPKRVAALKAALDGDLTVLGSGELVRSLLPHRLIDEYVLTVVPVLLGSGRRLFPDPGPFESLRLVEAKIGSSGAVLAVYRPRNR